MAIIYITGGTELLDAGVTSAIAEETMTFNDFMPYLPLIIPIVLIDLGLKIAALVDILKKQPKLRGPKWLWIVIAAGVNIIGPILYFTLGREEA